LLCFFQLYIKEEHNLKFICLLLQILFIIKFI